MDIDQFDTLTARITAHLTRRRSLGLLGALGLTSTVFGDDANAAKRKKKHKKKGKKKKKSGSLTCSAPTVACGQQCVTLDTTSNCGRCGVQCPAGQSCLAGICQNANGCGDGEISCGRSCCTNAEICQGGLFCVACGGPAEPCCANQNCDSGLACIFQGTICGPPM